MYNRKFDTLSKVNLSKGISFFHHSKKKKDTKFFILLSEFSFIKVTEQGKGKPNSQRPSDPVMYIHNYIEPLEYFDLDISPFLHT